MLVLCLLIPLIVGGIAGLLSIRGMQDFEAIIKPPASPPGVLFPIVWTILYLLMGVSSYLVATSNKPEMLISSALRDYACQLLVNFIWPLLFFNLKLYWISFIWLILLWILIVMMILHFYRIRPLAAYLQIPYLLWVTYAGYLNLGIAILNR